MWGADDRLRETGFLGVAGLAGSVLLGYLGFATYDDRNIMRLRQSRDNKPPPLAGEDGQ